MIEKLELTDSEFKVLKTIQRTERNKKNYVKVTIIVMFYSGLNISSIVDFLGIDETTVYRNISLYRDLGLEKYLDSNYLGYIGKLSYTDISRLRKEISADFYNDSGSICDLVDKKYGEKYTRQGMISLLHRIGFVYKKTRLEPCDYDIEKQKIFVEDFNKLNSDLKSTEAIYFSDAVHPQHNTRSSYCWVLKGEDKDIKSVSGRKRVNINGLLNANDVTDIVTISSDTINSQSTQELYQKLIDNNPEKDKIYIICDNARYYKNKALNEWLVNTKIVQVFLPPYSPNLNIIERLWKFLKKEVINTTFYRTFDEFKNGISNFFKNIKNYKDKLETLLTNNFHIKPAN